MVGGSVFINGSDFNREGRGSVWRGWAIGERRSCIWEWVEGIDPHLQPYFVFGEECLCVIDMKASAPRLPLNFSFSEKLTAIKAGMHSYINAGWKWAVCGKTGLCRDTIPNTIPVSLQTIIIMFLTAPHIWESLIDLVSVQNRWGPTAIPERAPDISRNCCSCVLNF